MKKYKNYLITIIVASIILGIVYLFKGFYPFGDNYIVWGDLHAQITAMYYHLHDAVYSGKSLLVNFTTGGGINFLGNLAYYILSPFSIIVLFFERTMIPHAVSIIIFLKIILSTVTCEYLLKTWFKKLKPSHLTLLSIIYAFSSYSLSLYIIPAWLDIVIIFPIFLVGLRKILDLEDKKLYLITLSLSFILNFYLTVFILIFTVLASFIYLKVYNNKKRQEAITNLGIMTLLSIMLSSIIVIPTINQIMASARAGFNLSTIMYSRFGPISDKGMFLITSFLPIAASGLLILDYKKHKKFLLAIIPLLIVLGIPLFIEPINKMFHLGSYMYYPYRYGFITILLFIVMAGYYFNNLKEEKSKYPLISLGTTIFGSISIIYLVKRFYPLIQTCVAKLTFTYSHKALFIMLLIFVIAFISSFIILYLNKNNSTKTMSMLGIITLTTITSLSLCYLGIDSKNEELTKSYNDMYKINELINDNYRLKLNTNPYIENIGFVTNVNSLDSFTSLIDNNAFLTNQYLGYNSYWMNTASSGSNLFIDLLLGHKYLITEKENPIYYKELDKELNLYQTTLNPSLGYFINENIKLEETSSFINTNKISNSLMNEDVFEVINDFEFNNLTYENNKLTIIDPSKEAYFTKTLNIDNSNVYLEIINSYINKEKQKIYRIFDVYVNNKLLVEEYPNKENMNSIDLGYYSNEIITIKVVVKKSCELKHISLGILNLEKTRNFFSSPNSINLITTKNKAIVNTNSEKEGIIFIPINYLKGMKATNNNKSTEIIKIFNNYLGIKVEKGTNNIEINYIPEGLKLGILITILGSILTFIFLKEKINLSIIHNISYKLFVLVTILILLIIYIIPSILFLLGFIL